MGLGPVDIYALPMREARWKTISKPGRGICVIVIHSMEAPEKGTTAEAVANYFQNLPETKKASAHYNIDNNSIVQCVQTKDIAYAAPGCNRHGLQLEHAGYARQRREDWLDDYSTNMLMLSARLSAALCKKFGIAVKFLNEEKLKNVSDKGWRYSGFTTHAVVTNVFRQSDHTDPGNGFPMDLYLKWVQLAKEGKL